MELDPAISAALKQQNRKLIRTNAILFEDQIQAVVEMSGEDRGSGKKKFAQMFRIALDAGILVVQSNKGKTPRVAAKLTRGVATQVATQE